MKFAFSLILFLAFVPAITSDVAAQDASGAAQAADKLRLQLLDTQAKEAELQARERQLDEDLKPENIERSLAGIGSTKPEDLRELRRHERERERERGAEVGGASHGSGSGEAERYDRRPARSSPERPAGAVLRSGRSRSSPCRCARTCTRWPGRCIP